MNSDELQMTGRDHWHALLLEAEVERRVRRPRAALTSLRPRLARALVSLAARLDPVTVPQRRATTSL